jgi:pyruvate formate lyase activating enzyme
MDMSMAELAAPEPLELRAEGLHFAYAGNVAGHPAENTHCPSCQALVIERSGLHLVENRLEKGHCPKCKRGIAGVWA